MHTTLAREEYDACSGEAHKTAGTKCFPRTPHAPRSVALLAYYYDNTNNNRTTAESAPTSRADERVEYARVYRWTLCPALPVRRSP